MTVTRSRGRREPRLQNVTLTLPEHLLREARHLAVDEGVSLSRYLARLLEERVGLGHRYRAARARQRALLQSGVPIGADGQVTWSRESLHER